MASSGRVPAGRVGVNIVTSMWDAEAQNHSMSAMGDHALRYERAKDFLSVLTGLLGSYPASAVVAEKSGNYVATDKLSIFLARAF